MRFTLLYVRYPLMTMTMMLVKVSLSLYVMSSEKRLKKREKSFFFVRAKQTFSYH